MPDEKREKLKPIVNQETGLAEKKEGFGSRLVHSFVEGTKEEITDYLINDILIPGAKDAFLDMMEMILFNKGGSSRKRRKEDDYSMYYKNKKRESKKTRRSRDEDDGRITDYRDVVLKNRDDAYEIVDQLHYRIEELGAASIADLLDLVDLPTKPSDNDFGWERKSDISVRRVANGFLIDVPKARYIE